MTEPFFPTYDSKFTKTPNVFFDEIIMNEKVTLNEVRIIAYLIRNTLGYHRDAKWVGVTREDLIKYAKVSGSRIAPTIKSCEEKGWILTYMEGINGNQKRYIFLNDELNVKIVKGLREGKFTVKDLQYLNMAGIRRLVEDGDNDPYHGETPPPQDEQKEDPYHDETPSTVNGENTEKDTKPLSRRKGGGNTMKGVKGQKTRNTTGSSDPLKKDLSLKNNTINNKERGKDPRYTVWYELFPDY